MEVLVRMTGTGIEIGSPRLLLEMTFTTPGPYRRSYAVAPGGQRFLVNGYQELSSFQPIKLVTNRTAGLGQQIDLPNRWPFPI